MSQLVDGLVIALVAGLTGAVTALGIDWLVQLRARRRAR